MGVSRGGGRGVKVTICFQNYTVAYFRKIWLALKRAVRFSFLEFSIRGDSVPLFSAGLAPARPGTLALWQWNGKRLGLP